MATEPNHNWYKIAESLAEINFRENGLTEIEINGKKFCVGLQKDQLFACSQKCPHAGGVLADGYMDAAGNLVCPVHRYKFDPMNGRNVSGEGYYLKRYAIEQREDGIYISLETGWLFGK